MEYKQVASKDLKKFGKITKIKSQETEKIVRTLNLKEGVYTTFSPELDNKLSVKIKGDLKENKELSYGKQI